MSLELDVRPTWLADSLGASADNRVPMNATVSTPPTLVVCPTYRDGLFWVIN